MIDRKALQIFVLLLLAMTLGAVWRLFLLPDWRIPGHNILSAFSLFAAPVSLLGFMVTPLIQSLASPKETLPSWRRWSGKWIVSWSVFMALVQAFVLACSLGFVSLSDLGAARFGSMMIGLIFMIFGNAAPKAPTLLPSQHNSHGLHPWQQNRMLRFVGKLFVGLGLAFVLGGILLPLEYWRPVFGCLMVGALAAGIWYSIKLRHERLLQ